MRNKWLKRALWVFLTPILLFTILMVLLYVPPVQNFIRKQATAIASDATGMDISVDRIDLRFPLNLLVRGVMVVQPADSAVGKLLPDTLLRLDRLNVHIQARPLLKGKVEIDDVTLQNVAVNTSNLLEGMCVQGTLGRFFLESHGIDLNREDATLNRVLLEDTHIQVQLNDTTETPEDTTATALNWKVLLHAMQFKNVSLNLRMPLDSMDMKARIGNAELANATVDLKRQAYGWLKFRLSDSFIGYNDLRLAPLPSTDTIPMAKGVDFAHLALRDIQLGIDSVFCHGRDMKAVIRECSLNERSGLAISSLTARLVSDSTFIRVPVFQILTPHSELDFSGQTYWELINIPTTGRLSARFNARIGKQDVMLLAGNVPQAFKDAYPFHPLVLHAGTEGNLKQMQISRFTVDLPGAFSLNGGGEFWNLTDSVSRNGKMDFEMHTQDLNFLTTLTGLTPNGSLAIPDSMHLIANFGVEGSQCMANLNLKEEEGLLDLTAAYNLATETYQARFDINQLQLKHFLPQDSIYTLTATCTAHGKGMDFGSPHSVAALEASLKQLHYGRWKVANVELQAALKSAKATVGVKSDNVLLKMSGKADVDLGQKYMDGQVQLDVADVNLYRLGLASHPLAHPFAFTLGAEARRDSLNMSLTAGDLSFRFRARNTLDHLLKQSGEFATVLMKQLEDRRLNHADLRKVLPSAGMHLKAGDKNPVSDYLSTMGMAYHDMNLSFGFTPELGINGRTAIHGFRMDSLQLDTIFFTVRQDTARMRLQGGVVNGPRNPHVIFRSTLTGDIRNEDCELSVHYVDEKGKTGMLFGINARPLTEGNGKGNGLLLNLTPSEPVIAFRRFRFADQHNWIYLHKNMRVYANIDMDSDDGLCFKMQSNPSDTISLQNINVELNRFRLDELSKVIPYMPRLTGLFSAEANYVQTATALQVSAEADVQQLTYEQQPVGNIGLGATWLPGDKFTHYLNGYFTLDDEEVLTVDGLLTHRNGRDSLEVLTNFQHFPLRMANAFMPDQMVAFSGDVDGGVQVLGAVDNPEVRGDLTLDSVSVYARQAGARYWFDNRPVQIKNSRLLFDRFAIYTTSLNPFTIDGYVDFRDFDRPTANLKLQADNYTFLDAPRTRESLLYGKIFVDLNATVKGPLDGLTMRGSMSLLGNTNATYVLTDSPLTVEDRLDGLVTFTSFADTASTAKTQTPTLSLGGLNMNMSVHIDDAVRLRADLSLDRSKYIELEGGGDLNMQYSPQGDLRLTGRYTLSGGVMKYSLPIIPPKEFNFNPGSYVDWRGNIMNPTLNLKATDRIRASVADGNSDATRMVNFDASIAIRNKLEAPELVFDLEAPEDATIENELQAIGAEERSKRAIAMLATGIYLDSGLKGGGLTMGAALNSVLQSQINSLAGGMKGANISVGIEDRTSAETGDTQKDFSFRYSQRFFNDRVQIVIGGKVSTGANATNSAESFIDNISLEYRLDTSGTRYVRVFHNKNYESVLDGEITETGVGLVLRKKMDRLGELFIFRRKNKDKKK